MDVVGVLEWFKKLNKPLPPIVTTVGEDTYAVQADGTLGELVLPEGPVEKPVLPLATLTGLVAAYTADVDAFQAEKHFAVQVESFQSVALVSLRADTYGRRHVWARAKCAEENPFPFSEYVESERFLILAQASFMPIEGNYTKMLGLCSTLGVGTTVQVADDGFSQSVVVNTGGVTHTKFDLPPRIGLRPYRTFSEIDPVESDFLLRLRAQKDALPKVALIPVDANRWKTDTALQVGAWLKNHLPKDAVVIA